MRRSCMCVHIDACMLIYVSHACIYGQTPVFRVPVCDVHIRACIFMCPTHACRYGQTRPCFVYRLVSWGTMEEKIYKRQVRAWRYKSSIAYLLFNPPPPSLHLYLDVVPASNCRSKSRISLSLSLSLSLSRARARSLSLAHTHTSADAHLNALAIFKRRGSLTSF